MPSDAVSAAKQAAWQIAQDRVKAQVEATSWCTWLEPLRVLEIEDAMVVLAAPNVFVRNEVSEHYACIVTEALEEVLGRGVHVEFVIEALQAV
jgi:chromosomal replication initiator protein